MSTEIKETKTKTRILDIFRDWGEFFKAKDDSLGDDKYTGEPILAKAKKNVEDLERGQEEPINITKTQKRETSIPKNAQENLERFSKIFGVKAKEESEKTNDREER